MPHAPTRVRASRHAAQWIASGKGMTMTDVVNTDRRRTVP